MLSLPGHRRARLLIEAGVLAAFLALAFLALGRPSWFGDARGLLALHEHDAWLYHHRAYFPLARLVRALAPLDAEGSLRALSARSAAAGCALTYAAARRLGTPRSVALAVTGLLAASPAVLFFATAIEVHCCPSSGSRSWGRRAREGASPRGARRWCRALFRGLCAAHLSAALWIGGLGAVWLWSGRWLRWPRHGAAALMVLAVGGYAIFFLGRESRAGFGRLVLAGLCNWSPEPLARELLARSGILIPLALVEPLARELAHGGGVRTFTEREAHAVLVHAPRAITAASPDTGPLRPTDLGSHAYVAHALLYAERVRAQGGRLAITRSLYEPEERGAPGLVRRLVERFGAPARGEHAEYLVFPTARPLR